MIPPPEAPPPGSRGGLSRTSLDWLGQTSPAGRKAMGQYMTPRPVADALLDRLELKPGMKVLDPGVGTGELLRAVLDREPGLEVFGWDIDQSAIEAARELVPEASLSVRSALETDRDGGDLQAGAARSGTGNGQFDLVIGNPPYFQLRLAPAIRERFAEVISGRPNVFAMFFQAGLEMVRPGGTLAYIVPPSMNAGAYFEALREYLTARAVISDLTILEGNDWFEGANTAVQLLVLTRNEEPTSHSVGSAPFVFRREVPEARFRRVILTSDPGAMAAEFEGRKTLWELGLEAVTGQVIWNENRDRLFDREGPDRVPLIWSHSIGQGELRPGRTQPGPRGSAPGSTSRPGKPGFYDSGNGGKAPMTGPAIVVNRVVGAVGRGELRAALIPSGSGFLAENHVNVIRARAARGQNEIDWDAVLQALGAEGVAGRVRLLTGNTQISATELTHLLPLD